MSNSDYINGIELMLNACQSVSGSGLTDYTFFETVAPIQDNLDNLPAVVIRLLDPGIQWAPYSVSGSIQLDFIRSANPDVEYHQNITNFSDEVYGIINELFLLDKSTTGHLVNPLYSIAEPPQIMGETAGVVAEGDLMWASVIVEFGLKE